MAPFCKKVHDLVVDYGLSLAPYVVKEMFTGQVCDWLSTGVSSLVSIGCSFRELGAVVAVRSLDHTIYSLFKTSGDSEPSMTKSDLRQLRDANFAWTTETSVERIPVLPKNIAKNFMQTFFKKFGCVLIVAEGRRVLSKVPCYFTNVSLSYGYTFTCLFQPASLPMPSPTTVSSGGGVILLRFWCLWLHHLITLLLLMKFGQQTLLREPQRFEGVRSLSSLGT